MHTIPLMLGTLLVGCTAGSTQNELGPCTVTSPDLVCLITGVLAPSCSDDSFCANREVTQACRPTTDIDGQLHAACLPALGSGIVGDHCKTNDRCRSGICIDGGCTALCGQCPEQHQCEPRRFGDEPSFEFNVCRPRHAYPTRDLGPLLVSNASSTTSTITISPKSETIGGSLTVVAINGASDWRDTGHRVAFTELRGPTDTLLSLGVSSPTGINPASDPYPHTTSIFIPNTDNTDAAIRSGDYAINVGLVTTTDYIDYIPLESGRIEHVYIIEEPATERGGLLDLNVFFSAGVTEQNNIDAANAEGSPAMKAFLGNLAFYFEGDANIGLGQVRYGDIPGDYDVTESADDIREICELYAQPGPHGVSINIFIINDISFTAGFSGGVPGPPGVFGSPASGIVIEYLDNWSDTGTLAAHEVGHFLGLQHTTKIFSSNDGPKLIGHDMISDTPECLSGALVDCPDYRNLMFPFFPYSGLSLTAAQTNILRASPFLYEQRRETDCNGLDVWDIGIGEFINADSAPYRPQNTWQPGSCAEGDGGVRVQHLYIDTPGSYVATLTTVGTSATLSVRAGVCANAREEPTPEIACGSASLDTSTELLLNNLAVGDYYFIVDDLLDSGRFVLLVEEQES